ncbi:MAG: hypothetical protein IKT40_08875 [Bacilli bacterium]|nr:hypothetical protein [Bacilli bacterium]
MSEFLNYIRHKITESYYKIFVEKKEYFDNYDWKENLCFYSLFSENITKLPCEIYLDGNKNFLNENRKLFLLVNNKDSVIPISIENNPKILLKKLKLNISEDTLNQVVEFIKKNKYKLIEFANNYISYDDINKHFKKISENNLLLEYHTIDPSDSGLKLKIWVDENSLFQGHAPRIKFQYDTSLYKTRQFASMTISDNPEIKNLIPKNNLTSNDIRNIEKFVIANKENLLNLTFKKISYDVFKERMIKVVDGEIVPPKQEYKIMNDDFIFGTKIIQRNDGRFNYINSNNQLISKHVWFDEAYEFTPMENEPMGVVKLNNEWFNITIYGELIAI